MRALSVSRYAQVLLRDAEEVGDVHGVDGAEVADAEHGQDGGEAEDDEDPVVQHRPVPGTPAAVGPLDAHASALAGRLSRIHTAIMTTMARQPAAAERKSTR